MEPSLAAVVLPGVGVVATRGAVPRFVIATTISWYGDWLIVPALLVLLYQLTGSLVAPAGYTLVRVVARLLGPIPGGMVADRFSASTLVVVGSTASAGLTGILVAAASLRALWLLYVGIATCQLLSSMVRPAYPAVLGQIASGATREKGNALSSVGFSSAMFAGPAVGALLLPVLGARGLILLDAGSFLAIPVLMVGIHTVRGGQSQTLGVVSTTRLGEALSLLARDRTLRLIAALHFGSGITSAAAQVVLVVAAIERFGGVSQVGALYSAVGAGALVGGIAAIRWRPSPATPRLLLTTFLIEMGGITAFAVAPKLPEAIVALSVVGLASTLYETWGFTEFQRVVAAHLQGRVFGAVFQSLNVGLAIGAVASVVLITTFPWPVIVTGGAIAATLAVLLTVTAPLSPRTRRRRRSRLTSRR